jgi:hypothetical protein
MISISLFHFFRFDYFHFLKIIMKQETSDEQLDNEIGTTDDPSWTSTTKTTAIPFSNFYITKGTLSNGSSSQHKLSEQLSNTSSKYGFLLKINQSILLFS